MTDKKFLKINNGVELAYELEECQDMVYIRMDSQSKSIAHEEAASFEYALPKATISYHITHELTVEKEPVPVSKARFVFGIIFLVLGAILGILGFTLLTQGISYPPGSYAPILLVVAVVFIVLGVILIVRYKNRAKNPQYKTSSEKHTTLIEVFSNGLKVFSVPFYDPSKNIYAEAKRFIYCGEDPTEFVKSEEAPDFSLNPSPSLFSEE